MTRLLTRLVRLIDTAVPADTGHVHAGSVGALSVCHNRIARWRAAAELARARLVPGGAARAARLLHLRLLEVAVAGDEARRGRRRWCAREQCTCSRR